MELLIFIGGVFVGFITNMLLNRNSKIYGVIRVDHKNELCSVCITSKDLEDRRTKIAVLTIEHDANISRE